MKKAILISTLVPTGFFSISVTISCNQNKDISAHKVTLFSGQGKFSDTQTYISLEIDNNVTKLSDIEGYQIPSWDTPFLYWMDGQGQKYTGDEIITGDIYLQAVFAPKDVEYNIVLLANGGSFSLDREVIYLPKAKSGTKIKETQGYELPQKDGLIFSGWTNAQGEPTEEDAIIAGNLVLSAVWTETPGQDLKIEGHSFTLVGQPQQYGKDYKMIKVTKSGLAVKPQQYKITSTGELSVNNIYVEHDFICWKQKEDGIYKFVVEAIMEDGTSCVTNEIQLMITSYETDNSFQDDSWDNVTYFADMGLRYARAAYHVDSLIGFTRYITLKPDASSEPIQYQVKVIGENEDFLDAASLSPTALTFRFNNVISDSNGNALHMYWDNPGDIRDEKNFDYWNSTMETGLNGSTAQWLNTGITSSVWQMIEYGNPVSEGGESWIQHMKQVYKPATVSPEQTIRKWVTSYNNVRLFIPTIAELFSPNSIRRIPTSFFQYYEPEYYDMCIQTLLNEGNQYSFYWNTIGDENCVGYNPGEDEQQFEALYIESINGTEDFYHLRTPRLDEEGACYIIDEQQLKGYLLRTFGQGRDASLAPCFCI